MNLQEIDFDNLTPKQDIEIFKKELEDEHYGHAIFHLACAIASNPSNEEWLFYADAVCDSLGFDVFKYVPLDKSNYFATIALRSYFLWRLGDGDPAVNLLSQVMPVAQDSAYFIWIENWLKDTEVLKTVQEQTLFQLITRCMRQMDDYTKNKNWGLIYRLIDIFKEFEEPIGTPYMTKYMVLSMLQRRIGQTGEALKSAQTGFEKVATAVNATFVALCYKEMDDLDNMEKYTRLSLKLDPEAVAICNDMGDTLLSHNQYHKAAKFYKILLKQEPQDSWALPSYYYCRYCEEQDNENGEGNLELLIQYCKTNPDNDRARWLKGEVNRRENPHIERFYYQIPYVQEALTNLLHSISDSHAQTSKDPLIVLRRVDSSDKSGSSVKTTLSCLESPSAINAIRLYLSDYGKNDINFELICNRCPDPNPLEPIEGDFKLWDYTPEYYFTSRVGPPTEAIRSIVGQLAATHYEMAQWYEDAKDMVQELTLSDLENLIGAMVYPPVCPNEDYYMDWWLFRVQYAAVFLIAGLEAKEGKYPSPTLKDICMGQIDWPILPAMMVLAYQCQLDSKANDQVFKLFTSMIGRVYKEEYCFFLVSYLVSALNLPGWDDDNRNYFMDWLKKLLADEQQEA